MAKHTQFYTGTQVEIVFNVLPGMNYRARKIAIVSPVISSILSQGMTDTS